MKISFNALWQCHTNGDVLLAAFSAFSCLAIRAKTNVFLSSNIHMNFIHTGQDRTCLGLENCCARFERDAQAPNQGLPIDWPQPLSVNQISLLTTRWDTDPLVHTSPINMITLYLGSKLYAGLTISFLTLKMGSAFGSHRYLTIEKTGDYDQKCIFSPDFQLKILKTTGTHQPMLILNMYSV
jgi:hypothetical protein